MTVMRWATLTPTRARSCRGHPAILVASLHTGSVEVEAVQVFTSLLAIGAAVIVLAVGLGLALRSSVGWVDEAMSAVEDAALWIAFLVAAVATFGSLYFSEVADLEPCRLCWFQRIAMYPSTVILFVAALRNDRAVRWYVTPLAAIGACVSLYHYVIEWRPNLEGGACDFGPSCSAFYFRQFGFVTLAFMALCGFLAIATLTWIANGRTDVELGDTGERPEP